MNDDRNTEEKLQRELDLLKSDQSDLGISSLLTQGQSSPFIQALLHNSEALEKEKVPKNKATQPQEEQRDRGTEDHVVAHLAKLSERRKVDNPENETTSGEIDLSEELSTLVQRRTTTLSADLVAQLVAGVSEEQLGEVNEECDADTQLEERVPVEPFTESLGYDSGFYSKEPESIFTAEKALGVSRSFVTKSEPKDEQRLDFQPPQELPGDEPQRDNRQTELASLADQKNWAELTKRASELMNCDGPQALEARLWWIRGQFEERSVPLSILAAPLHSALEQLLSVEKNQSLENEALELCLSVSNQLQQRGDEVLSLSLAERALELRCRDNVKESQRVQLEHLSRGSSKEDLEVYRRVRSIGSQVIASLSDIPEYKRTDTQALELQRLNDLFAGLHKEVKAKTPVEKEEDLLEVEILKKVKGSSVSWGQYRSLIVLLACIIGSGVIWRAGVIQDAFAWITATPQGGVETVLQREKPQLLSPEPRRRLTDKLDAIESLLDSVGSQKAAPVQVAKAQGVPVAQFAPPQKMQVKEVLNLSGPLEPTDFPQAEIGGEPKSSGGGRYPIKRFSSPKVYEIIARTQILKQPSYTAEVVGTLHVGHRVEASASHGPWLRLRSKSGRAGYILSQDSKGPE